MKDLVGKQLVLFETKKSIDYCIFYYDDIICVINDFDKFETFLKENYDISQSDYESLLDGVVIHVSGCELFIDTVDICQGWTMKKLTIEQLKELLEFHYEYDDLVTVRNHIECVIENIDNGRYDDMVCYWNNSKDYYTKYLKEGE